MKATFDVSGFEDIEADLAAIPKAMSDTVIRRAMVAELQPIADAANGLWPGSNDEAFGVSRNLKGRRVPRGGPITMYVGSTSEAPHAHLLEWGTEPRYHKSGKYVGAVAPTPILTPSWDAQKEDLLMRIAARLREEFDAALQRRARAFVRHNR